MPSFFGVDIGGSAQAGSGSQNMSGSGTQTSKLNISQQGLDKIIQDILGQSDGLAQLVQGQNSAGLMGSSTTSLLAQRFTTDLAGELAKLTAETVTNKQEQTQTATKQKSGGVKTVICTELARQGLLDLDLYDEGTPHFLSLPEQTVRGYRVWANKVVPLMRKSSRLSKTLAPIAHARYMHVTGKKKNLIGWLTVHVCEPLCYFIGAFVPAKEEYSYENVEH